MSEGSGGGAQAPASRATIRSPKDFWGGLSLVALAAFAIWASSDLPGMRGFAFGPGTAPRLFAYCLMASAASRSCWSGCSPMARPASRSRSRVRSAASALLAALIPVTYYSQPHRPSHPGYRARTSSWRRSARSWSWRSHFLMDHVAPRGPLFITAATLIFAVTVRPLGLVIASFVSLVVSAAATDEMRWVETLIWAAVLTAFCSLLFPYGLNLPLQLWPRF